MIRRQAWLLGKQLHAVPAPKEGPILHKSGKKPEIKPRWCSVSAEWLPAIPIDGTIEIGIEPLGIDFIGENTR